MSSGGAATPSRAEARPLLHRVRVQLHVVAARAHRAAHRRQPVDAEVARAERLDEEGAAQPLALELAHDERRSQLFVADCAKRPHTRRS